MTKKIENLQLIVHVGTVLGAVAAFDGRWDKFADAKVRLGKHVEQLDEELADGKGVMTLIAPEVMRNEIDTLKDVLRTLSRTRKEGQVLSVLTFSENILGPLLNCVFDLDLHLQALVVLHMPEGQSMHALDAEGFLLDWPYGVLLPRIEWQALPALGFPEAPEIHRRRELAYQEKRAAEGQSREAALTHYQGVNLA